MLPRLPLFSPMFLLCCAFVGIAAQVWGDDSQTVRVLTYNIHHGEGIDQKLDLERIAEVIRRVKPDVVALQEVDHEVTRSKQIAQPAELARLLGMEFVFGNNISLQGGEYGNAVLSRWPIVNSINYPCPTKDQGEQRGVLVADIAISDNLCLQLFATHFDHRDAEDERLASAAMVNELLKQSTANQTASPKRTFAVLAGDLNAVPESETVKLLSSHWSVRDQATPTVPVSAPTRQIDYVLPAKQTGLVVLSSEVIDELLASDHRPLLTVVRVSKEEAGKVAQPVDIDSSKPISRILFGSCIQQDQPMPIFETMLKHRADLAVFLGDNIYADTADMQLMRTKYATLGSDTLFKAFRAAIPCLATWDDHDYGLNDGGAEFAMRDESQRAFLDFWQDPHNSARRQRPGVYDARILGPVGQRIQIILLDTRYFRSALKKGMQRVGGTYTPDNDPAKTMLGETQWQWLESELKRPAELRILATSIQCLPTDAGQETWGNLPAEQQRLFDLIAKTSSAGVILISGDRHWAELSAIKAAVPYPLYEMTSSSFNQPHPRGTPTENGNRLDPRTYHKQNYGVLAMDWQQPEPSVTMEVRDVDGQVQIYKRILIKELQFPE